MPIKAIAWQNFIDENTGLINGQPWPWQYGSNDTMPLDLSDLLDEGEAISDPEVVLRAVPAQGETDYLDAQDRVGQVTISGTGVLVPLFDLERGRYYKLDILFGPADHRRGGNTMIRVSQ